MTHPNLLRLVRSCAKWRSGFLLLGTLFLRGPAPGGVTDLTATAVSDSAVVLQWTEVRSSTTAIPRYVVRYGPLGAFQWPTSADVLSGGCTAPIVGSNATGGRAHACVLSGLEPHTAYQFQLVAYTGVLNTIAVFGPLSNIADATTMQRIGPALVWRSGMFQDTIPEVTQIISPWGTWAVTIHLPFGDYRGTLVNDSGVVKANAYLLLLKP